MPVDLLGGVVVAAIAGLVAIDWFFSQERRTRRRIEKLREVRIEDVREGELVRVTGRLRFRGEPLIAPISGRPCAGYRVHLEQFRHEGRGRWVMLVTEAKGTELELDDGTGVARLTGRYAELVLGLTFESACGTFHKPTEPVARFLAKHDVEPKNLLGLRKSLRCREGILAEGELVTAIGVGRWKRAPDLHDDREHGYRDVPRRLELEHAPLGVVTLSNDPRLITTRPRRTRRRRGPAR